MGLDQWTRSQPLAQGSYHSVAYGNGEFVAVGPNSIIRSQDEGTTWTPINLTPPRTFARIAFGFGNFVAVGGHRFRWNGASSWVSSTAEPQKLRSIAFGLVPQPALPGLIPMGGLFVAVGDKETIVISQDGVTWADVIWSANLKGSDSLLSIAFGNQRFVAAGQSGKILTSLDGVNWHPQTALTDPIREGALMFGANAFVGVTISNKVVMSLDGSSWSVLASTGLVGTVVKGFACAFGTFVAAGADGVIRTSPGGVVWTNRSSGSLQHLGGIAYGKNRFVAVGAGGASGGDIVRSGEFPSANLSALSCSAGPLIPSFNPSVSAYRVQLATNVATAVTPTSEDPQAAIRVRFESGGHPLGSDEPVASGTPSTARQIGGRRTQVFFISVTALNNTTRVYSVALDVDPVPLVWK